MTLQFVGLLMLALALGATLGFLLAMTLVVARTPDEPPTTDDLK